MILIIIAIVLLFVLYFKFIKPYRIKHDTIILYTGGCGSGKTYFSVKTIRRLYEKLRFKVFFRNLMHKIKREDLEVVNVYSSIPIRLKRNLYTYELTNDILLGESQIPFNSIVFIDEVNLFMSQWDMKNPNSRFVECFVSLYRHLTKGGYMVLNTQNVHKINHIFRYCASESFNLHGFRKITPFFVYTNCRRISLSDDVISVSTDMLEDSEMHLWSFNNPFFKRYDTYCHSNAIKDAPKHVNETHKQLKSTHIIKIPKKLIEDSHFDKEYL